MADLVNGLGGAAGFGTSDFVSMSKSGSEEYVQSNGIDDSSVRIDLTSALPSGINLFGKVHTSAWINANGNITFDAPNHGYVPEGISGLT
ncbi:MAG: hypothetical protein ACJA1L_001269 [Paracoccaceae bacterium]|jgi:hypothetical protein